MDYELYHDESKEEGYWHGILLVPVSKKQTLVSNLGAVRETVQYPYPIGIKRVKRPGRIYTLAECWVQIGVLALMSVHKGPPPGAFLGNRVKGKKQYSQFTETTACKFIVFREIDDHTKMSDRLNYAEKVETTFRIGLKGGLHFTW